MGCQIVCVRSKAQSLKVKGVAKPIKEGAGAGAGNRWHRVNHNENLAVPGAT